MKFKTNDFSNFSDIASRMTNIKKVKLNEHKAKYEDLIT